MALSLRERKGGGKSWHHSFESLKTHSPTEKEMEDLNESFEVRGQTRHHTDSDGHNFQGKTLFPKRESFILVYTETVRETQQTL